MNYFAKLFIVIVVLLTCTETYAQVNIIFTSDVHFGITRKKFRGDTGVSANVVNAAVVKKMNTLPQYTLPADGGVGSGKQVGAIDYLAVTGDIANRMEIPYQSAADSWAQFRMQYLQGITLKGHDGQPMRFLLTPGNHDISNAIGFNKKMNPATDPSSMVQIYNLMMHPATPLSNANYNYATDKINYSADIKGVHFMFVNLWPDSANRVWMQKDLEKVAATTPVIIFCHDPPISDSKHFTNPVPPYNMTAANKFENLIAEHYKEGASAGNDANATNIEQRAFVKFLKLHPNIKAYFHGHSNYNEFYVYHGPDNDVALNTFRVDSPMKGSLSAKDETKLSFQLISLDPEKQELTVRECLWDTNPADPNSPIVFGASKTISLKVN